MSKIKETQKKKSECKEMKKAPIPLKNGPSIFDEWLRFFYLFYVHIFNFFKISIIITDKIKSSNEYHSHSFLHIQYL